MMLVQPATALQGPQLSAIRAADPAAAVDAITRLLGYVDGMFNFAAHKKLNTLQASMLANDIAQRYWSLKFDEVVYVLREGANGRYHTFDRIDPGVIHGWFAEYQAERDALVEQIAHNETVASKKAAELANTNTVAFLHGQPLQQAKAVDMHRTYTYMALRSRTDEELQAGVDYYTRHVDAPEATLKREVAQQLLDERRATEAARSRDAHEKARALLAELDAADTPSPDLEAAALEHFDKLPGLSDLKDAPMKVIRNTETAA